MVRFVLEIDLAAVAGDPEAELSRILRYWAGNMKHYPLEPGATEVVSDSAYTPVGRWEITDDAEAEAVPDAVSGAATDAAPGGAIGADG